MKSFGKKPWLLPQPVLIIGTYDREGKPNAMNAAWAGTWDDDTIMISMGTHYTTRNLNEKGEFTVAFATVDTLVASDFVGIVSMKNDTDKIKKTGWTVVSAEHVNAPVFKEFPMTMECRVKEKLNTSATGFYLVAEVVNIFCDEAYLAEDGKPDMTRMNLISFDPIHNRYIRMGDAVGKAFADGRRLK
ncbi:flavin reductase (DIM6/NTAB) family NADH-FMN oxidoreductase RutF [Bacteroides zoogleoformans]|uniref:Flavin oxidoreductase n=1 Tax=Bacteroides zoogleoformans TaxID=28119 RepID=A0ABM6T787_9BACE|nr:flavin reductase family protein [Bacteroides zoogleoformans]AVM52656.1 flavin oxidoreductase [Bacteroides zoogleoformans]TWJ17663.1 flavin reductase (DIM6/NTAB) family NADH-FMN oxidoreductase RutF [Bacteroides zoogleoformans]